MSCKIVCNILKSLLFSLFIRLEKVCDESLVAQTTRAAPKPCRRKRKIVSALSSPYMLFSLSAFQTADRSKTRKETKQTFSGIEFQQYGLVFSDLFAEDLNYISLCNLYWKNAFF